MKKKTTTKKKVIATKAVKAPVAPPALPLNHVSKTAPVKAKKPVVSVERARKRLIERHGYAEDELKTLFKTDEELIKFYNEIAASEVDDDTEKAIGWDMTDAMDAPIDDKERFRQQKLEAQRRAFEKQQAAAAQPAPAAGKPVGSDPLPSVPAPAPETPKTLEEDCARLGLSMKDFLDAGDALDSLLDDDDDSSTEKA